MFIILQIWFNSLKLAWMECFFSICVFILYQCETFVNWWITVLDEQCETFVICNDGTMCWLCMYIWSNLCVGYDCYMDACCIYICWLCINVGYVCIYDGTCVLAMIVIWMRVVYIYVGYGCYMELCVGYVLAMYVYLICEIVTWN